MVRLDREYFETQMKGFASFVGIDAPNKMQAAIYYERFKNYDAKKFHKVIYRLYETWKYKHFPLLADFVQAAKELFAGDLPEYKLEPRVDDIMKVTRQKECKRIIEAMLMLRYLRGRCKKKDIEWIPFIKDMLKKNMVYLKKEKKWVSAGKVDITDNVFEPRKHYPLEYYK